MNYYSFFQYDFKRYIGLWIVLLALLVGWLSGQASAQSGAEIKKINFSGNKTFKDKHLRRELETRRSSQFSKLVFGKKKHAYDEKAFNDELRGLTEFYQREGFLDVSIGPPKVEYDSRKDEVRLTVPVSEGPAILVGSVSFEYTGLDDAERERIISAIKKRLERTELRTGRRFRDADVLVDQDTFRIVLANQGYPYARPEHRLDVDTLGKRVDVAWVIDSGPLAHFENVSIRGNQRVSEDIIARMVAFKSGERYDRRLVERTQQHVYGLGMFQVATVHEILSDPPNPGVPIEISVREQPRYRAQTSIGYGSDEKLRGLLDMRKYGFLGGARTLRLYARFSHLEPYNIRPTLSQPAFFHPRSALSITPYLWRQDEEAFSVRRIGGEVSLTHTFNPRFNGSVTYVPESVRLVGDTLVPDLIVEGRAIRSYRKSSVVFSSQYDSSTPVFSPVRGIYGIGNLTYSGLGFGSFRFWKFVGEARHYRRYLGMVFAGRLKAGSIEKLGTSDFVPYEERLFSGGSASVRGWARHELGPEANGVPIGGSSLIEGSFEVRYPVFGILGGAVFWDFGNVWLNSFDYRLNDFRYAAGIGIRLTTPFGPVRADLARPVFDEEDRFQLSLSIGQAF